jgi:Tol biopolymer transport system component
VNKDSGDVNRDSGDVNNPNRDERGGLEPGLSNAESARPVTSGDTSGETTWSPDGKIVFQKIMGQGEMNIWVMVSDGSNARQLTAIAGRINVLPRVSPDGRYIVFVSERTGTAHLWRMDMNGGNPHQLTNNPDDYSWPRL